MTTARESRAALTLVTGAAVGMVTSLLGRISGTAEEKRAMLLDGVPGIIDYYSVGAAALAADFYDDQRELASPPKLYLAEPIIIDRTEKIRRAISWASDPLFADNPVNTEVRLAEVVQLETARPYRDTILTNRRNDPSAVGWRRVSSGKCRFCRMLADRGAVYKEKTARFAAHENCHCSAQPVFSTDDFGQEASVMQYMASAKKRTPAQQAKLRAYLDANYGPSGSGTTKVGAVKPKSTELGQADKTARLKAQMASLETTLPKLQERAAGGEDVSKAIKWQQDRLAELNRQLG